MYIGIAEGDTYAQAYRTAYDAKNMSDKAIRVEASRLASNPIVSLMVMELQEAANIAKGRPAKNRRHLTFGHDSLYLSLDPKTHPILRGRKKSV